MARETGGAAKRRVKKRVRNIFLNGMFLKTEVKLGNVNTSQVFDKKEDEPRNDSKSQANDGKGNGLTTLFDIFGVPTTSKDGKPADKNHNEGNNPDKRNNSLKNVPDIDRQVGEKGGVVCYCHNGYYRTKNSRKGVFCVLTVQIN